jgi:hypothetical protein
MMHQAVNRLAMGQGHFQRGQRQRGRQRVVHRPADATARVPI